MIPVLGWVLPISLIPLVSLALMCWCPQGAMDLAWPLASAQSDLTTYLYCWQGGCKNQGMTSVEKVFRGWGQAFILLLSFCSDACECLPIPLLKCVQGLWIVTHVHYPLKVKEHHWLWLDDFTEKAVIAVTVKCKSTKLEPTKKEKSPNQRIKDISGKAEEVKIWRSIVIQSVNMSDDFIADF